MSNIENLYTTDCIRTFTGKYINVFDPKPEDICIEDIAHALSCIPRFGGHLRVFYPVAMHSISVYGYVKKRFPNEPKLLLQALMHDASEAYLLDMPSPIKKRMPEYRAIEDVVMSVIAEKFDFGFPFQPIIKEADKAILEYEWNRFVINGDVCHYNYPSYVSELFLLAFNNITK